jgi:uncharacterized membrane protein YphA (DoxX/SURF4 family)
MNGDTVGKSALAPFILRITLAVIFVYNGVMKINEKTDWGATWAAEKMWSKGLPEDVAEKIDKLSKLNDKKLSDEQKKDLKDNLAAIYNDEASSPPDTLSSSGVQMAVDWGEVAGGGALLVGLLTRLAALGMIVIQAGAIWMVTLPKSFAIGAGGYEFALNLALIAMCLTLVITGGGLLSIDHLWSRKGKEQPAHQVPVAV